VWPFRDLRIAALTYYATMPIAGHGLRILAEGLSEKPLLRRVGYRAMVLLLLAANMVVTNLYVYSSLQTLSLPWDIYLFAPSSLRG